MRSREPPACRAGLPTTTYLRTYVPYRLSVLFLLSRSTSIAPIAPIALSVPSASGGPSAHPFAFERGTTQACPSKPLHPSILDPWAWTVVETLLSANFGGMRVDQATGSAGAEDKGGKWRDRIRVGGSRAATAAAIPALSLCARVAPQLVTTVVCCGSDLLLLPAPCCIVLLAARCSTKSTPTAPYPRGHARVAPSTGIRYLNTLTK